MAFTINVGVTNKRKNSTKLVKDLGTTFNVVLKEPTSILRPVFELHTSSKEILHMNYCYCEEFKRYYFISSIKIITACVYELSCEVDVLATYSKEIKETKAFITRAQSKTDITITDGMLGCCNNCELSSYEKPMTCGSPTKDGTYNLTVNCEGGAAQTGAMTKSHLQSLGSRLYSNDVIARIKDSLFNPASCLGGCTWTPFTKTGPGSVDFTVGGEQYGVFAQASDFEQEIYTLTPIIKYYYESDDGSKGGYGDFRNFPPYASYYLYLPAVGFVELDARKIILEGEEEPQIYVYTSVCPRTGDITYMVYNNRVALILEAGGNISYPVQISSLATTQFNIVSEVGGVSAAIMGAVTGNPLVTAGGIGALLSNDISLNSYQSTIRGSMGGSAADIENIFKFRMMTFNRFCSDDPQNIRSTIGMPLLEAHVLGTMNGFVSCRGAYVQCNALAEEHKIISSLLNGGVDFSGEVYGGVLIE